MHRFRRLAVGLARNESDLPLIRYAAMICRLGTVEEVRFLHVLSRASGPQPMAVDHAGVQQELLRTVGEQFTPAPPSVRVMCDVVDGPLTDQLLAYTAQQQVDLLLVGHRRGHSGRRALARRLAMKAPCSVWMAPQDSPPALSKILVPIDFSEHAADTMLVACSMARLTGASHCLALHVYFNEAVVTYEGYDAVLRGQEEEAWRKFIAPIDCQGVTVTPIFEENSQVASTIRRIAGQEGADLIVMGTRGRSRSASILLGSVTEDMIIDAQVPLLAVKHFGARMSVLQALLDPRFLYSPGLHTD
jgi:nucleotide-binding universal stress UspA family protein